jgi:hypothetical protein
MGLFAALEAKQLEVQKRLRFGRFADFEYREQRELHPHPHFAWALLRAARQARTIGLDAISAIEFGVAAGHGLRALEDTADEVQQVTGVRVEVYGFEGGIGMPSTDDPRDMPYTWSEGQFMADPEQVRASLRRAELIVGLLAETVPPFAARDIAPVGFASVDVDYYTSTCDALALFDLLPAERALPRALLYFDDVIDSDEWVGELRAIKDFNEGDERRRLGRLEGLRWTRTRPAWWNDAMYTLHRFDHPAYRDHIGFTTPMPRAID